MMIISRKGLNLVCCDDLVLIACHIIKVVPYRAITAGCFSSPGQRKFKTLFVLGVTAVTLGNKNKRLKIGIIALMGLDLKASHKHSFLSPDLAIISTCMI